jgi:RNA polymerase sigma-70 factor, ECF subfamily
MTQFCSAYRQGKAQQLAFPGTRKPVMATMSIVLDSTSFAAPQTAWDDMALVHACKRGDATAFEQLVKRYDVRLFNIAQHITRNREDAQDAVQEAFLKVFRKLTQFEEKSQFSTWLTRITVNESLMKLRKQRNTKEVSLDENFQGDEHASPFELADWAPDPEDLYGASELRNILRTELHQLQPGLRVVFVLRNIEGLSTEETAEVLELTHVAVKARLWRARLQLRQRLSKFFGLRATHS